MIVELIGCAGAGKTTLRRLLCEQGLQQGSLVAMPDLVRDRPVLRRIAHPTAVNVMQEVAGLPYFLSSWGTEREFIAYARRLLSSTTVSAFDRLNGLRGIVRKLGMYQLASRWAAGRVVLSDEGTVLSAYNLLVMTKVGFGRLEVERFLELVPLPEKIVYVQAPVATLVERATSRPDPRRQHLGGSRIEIEDDVRRTVELFELVATSPRLEERVLVVENDDADPSTRRRVAGVLAKWLEESSVSEFGRQTVDRAGALAGV